MKVEESLAIQGIQIAIDRLSYEITQQRKETEEKNRFKNLPEWVTLDEAAKIKGGPALATFRTKSFLKPCCGRNYKLVGGRQCWQRDDVLLWLTITDLELKQYAASFGVRLPENYERRGA